MATELQVRIRPNRYEGREAMFRWNGTLYRYSFDSRDELAYQLVRDKIHPAIRDEVMATVEDDEWDRTPIYPLGVVYVGEAVCDFGEPEYDPRTVAFNRSEPSPFWEWAAATLRVGAVVAPWAILMLLCRLAYAKAAGWGW